MREDYKMPEWATVGAEVVAVHYNTSSWASYAYSEGLHMKVTRVLKTKVCCEATLEAGTDRERVLHREFKLGRNGLYEIGPKYSPDQLVANWSKQIHMIRSRKDLTMVQGKIVGLGSTLSAESARWMNSEKLLEFRNKMAELAEDLKRVEEAVQRASEMLEDEIIPHAL